MSDHDRFIGQLEDYLDDLDGDPPLASHVRDAIRAALPATRQVRPGWRRWRVLTMFSGLSTPVRGGLLAAGLVVAVALAATLLPSVSGTGVAPPSVAPSVAPTPTTVASASPAASGAVPISQAAGIPCYEGGPTGGCVAGGTYALNPQTIPGEIVITVPDGWFPWEPGAGAMALLVDSGPDAPGGSGWGPLFSAIEDVRRDPCAVDVAVFDPSEVDSPAAIATAMAAWPGFDVSDPTEITFAGAPGVQFEVSAADDLGACPATATWSTPITWIDAYPMADGEPATFRILDVDGRLLVIRTPASIGPSPYEVEQGVAADPERHAEHMVELEAMLDSVEFGAISSP